ncbi:MAG: hypothetical protein GY811_02075 [Myxococcales bacterium]|nr:hypothetical protein [Myxococcales bacterium]
MSNAAIGKAGPLDRSLFTLGGLAPAGDGGAGSSRSSLSGDVGGSDDGGGGGAGFILLRGELTLGGNAWPAAIVD